MIGKNEYIPTPIISSRGIIDISDLFPGDYVVEYKTGKKVRVLNTVKRELQDVYKVTYTDGRTMNILLSDRIFTGTKIMNLIATKKEYFTNIKCYPVDLKFLQYNSLRSLMPDPYITGALLMYGDYDKEYINLPIDLNGADEYLKDRYVLKLPDDAPLDHKNLVNYFTQYRGNTDSRPTWKEFFPHYDFYLQNRRIDSPLFPREYVMSDIRTRVQFIMGVFDVGYNRKAFPDRITIQNKHEYRLKEFQKVLWSLGILSKVIYDPEILDAHGREYKLEVLGLHGTYPGFFYELYALEQFLLNDKHEKFQFKVDKIEKQSRGWTYNVLLERPDVIYLDADYLPRVSM